MNCTAHRFCPIFLSHDKHTTHTFNLIFKHFNLAIAPAGKNKEGESEKADDDATKSSSEEPRPTKVVWTKYNRGRLQGQATARLNLSLERKILNGGRKMK